MLRNSPEDNDHGRLQVDFELIETAPVADRPSTSQPAARNALTRATRHLTRTPGLRRRLYAGLVACLLVAISSASTHAWDVHTQRESQLAAVASHVEILNLSDQSRTLASSTDNEIPFAVFNDGTSPFTLIAISVNEPDLVLPARLPTPIEVPPGAPVSVPLRFTESCAKRSSPVEPNQVELTVRNAYGNEWSANARLIDPLHALSAARSLCTSPATLTASLAHTSSTGLLPAIHGNSFTIPVLVENQNPRAAYVSGEPDATAQQGFAVSSQVTQVPPDASQEIDISIRVTNCQLALTASQVIDAPPIVTVDANGNRDNGVVVFAPTGGQSLRFSIAGGLLKTCHD